MRDDVLPSESFKRGEAAKKTDRRVVRTKRALFDAYERLAEKGENTRITISALTREADIDRKTFYLHFSSIDDMLDDMVSELVSKILAPFLEKRVVLRNDAEANTPEEAGRLFRENVRSMYDEVNNLLRDNEDAVRRIMANTSLDRLLVRFREPLYRELKRNSTISDEALDHVCTFVVGGLLSTYSMWLQEGCKPEIEKVSDYSHVILNYGVQGFLSSDIVDK